MARKRKRRSDMSYLDRLDARSKDKRRRKYGTSVGTGCLPALVGIIGCTLLLTVRPLFFK